MVSYYLNSKPIEVKELGKITLKMTRFMEESGDSTVRKGETVLENGKEGGGTGWQKRNGLKSKQS